MDTLHIEKVNNTFMKINTSSDIIEELNAHFTFTIPNAQFHPKVKARLWDGKIRMFKKNNRHLYLGLIAEVRKFCADRGYDIILDKDVKDSFIDDSVSQDSFKEFINNLPMWDSYNSQKMKWWVHQLHALWAIQKYKRVTVISATGTGKSAFLYGAVRYYQEVQPDKILLVVPSTGLVEQMSSDFISYSAEDENWIFEENGEKLYAGKRISGTQLLISTWQSLMKQSSEFFHQFGAVIIDETHGADAKELSTILENCVNAEYRIGCTGTLKDSTVSELSIKGLIGPVITVQTARQGMDNGILAELNISCVVLNYQKNTVPKGKLSYQEELEFLFNHEPRNSYISNLATGLQGNTLILFSRVDHGKALYESIKEKSKDGRKVFLIYSAVDATDRNDMRGIVEKEDNAIIIASYGTMAAGANIKRLHNVVFAAPSKSSVRVLQSIGRGLRKSSDKLECTLYDVVDNISSKNYAYNHWLDRTKMYSNQEYKYKVVEVTI